MPRTLLLDLDGTLVDTVPDLESALNRLMASRELPPFATPAVKAMVGDGVHALVAKAFAAHGRSPDASAVSDFMTDYEAHVADASCLFPDVLPTLHALAAQGWRLAVCTNKPEAAARSLMQAVGLAPVIEAVGGGDSFPTRKPDPAHLLATLALLGARPDEAVMIGDHRNDIVSARAAGIACVFAAWGYGAAAMAEGSDAVAETFPAAARAAGGLLPGA